MIAFVHTTQVSRGGYRTLKGKLVLIINATRWEYLSPKPVIVNELVAQAQLRAELERIQAGHDPLAKRYPRTFVLIQAYCR